MKPPEGLCPQAAGLKPPREHLAPLSRTTPGQMFLWKWPVRKISACKTHMSSFFVDCFEDEKVSALHLRGGKAVTSCRTLAG
ncbi:hypothetical protein EYF80_032590 [Liparis tanakae]|uniref:Uncharacterized protein n=1 Tax=Liparis tanakae TaxID=230148 RepID=A0A4Z2GV95_9TELE|nr:hypothetical protein EYF80_032590 [Liparis tanakae]